MKINWIFRGKIFLYSMLLTCLISLVAFPAYAQELDRLPEVKIPPGYFLYNFERIIEKVQVNFYISPDSKVDFYKNLLQKRLAELKYVVDHGYLDEVEKSSQRVSYQVGILSDYIKNKNLNSKKDSIHKLYQESKVVLEKLRDKYQANTSFWMLIQHVINSIDFNSQKF